jgi:glycosyltransferase A (GT-A) superfamily protein (DUF2064 family)
MIKIQTLRQYEAEMRARALAEYTELTGAEYDRNYPKDSRFAEWLGSMVLAAEQGQQLTARVLDIIATQCHSEYNVRSIMHSCPSAIPEGYMPPSVRKLNAAESWPKLRGKRTTKK